VFPTLADLCKLNLSNRQTFDGRSFHDQLTNPNTKVPERTLFVELQRSFRPERWQNAVAMTKRWRLVNNTELYDMKGDPAQQRNVIDQHPEVVAKLRIEFDAYWNHVTPGDRDRAEFIIGDDRDPVTFLHASDWYLPKSTPWNHALVAAGPPDCGDWKIRAARSGTYRFEVRRWPREANAALAGVPEITKPVDAWDATGPKPDLIYGNQGTPFAALPVTEVRLTVGDRTQTQPVAEGAKELTFHFELKESESQFIKAELLNRTGNVLAGGYYVYVNLSRP
jgi:hypothetical protein